MRNVAFVNEQYYHVYNRGVDKRRIFQDDSDYRRFLKSIKEFNRIDPIISLYIHDRIKENVAAGPLQNERLVEIIAFCLMSNHFHLIMKQEKTGGVPEFIKRVSGGYTGYFNHKYERSGVLFQGKFKAAHIDSQDKLLYLSAYVNGNHIVHTGKKEEWRFSSMREYSRATKKGLCNPKIIMQDFKKMNDYYNYALKTVREINKTREEMKQYIIE